MEIWRLATCGHGLHRCSDCWKMCFQFLVKCCIIRNSCSKVRDQIRHMMDGYAEYKTKLEWGPMPNVMVALPNIGCALCSTPNAAKFGWCPLLECRAVTLPRRESCWNLQGCPKLANRSQPLGGRSSPHYEDVGEVSLFNKFFFRLSIHAAAAKIQPDKVVQWCQNDDFFRPVFSASRVQHISDMHSKFALRPHHVWKYGRHPISNCWD